jgi:hypothetical protein
MVTLVVDKDKHTVVTLANKVSYIQAKVWDRTEFEAEYQPVRLVEDGLKTTLQQFRGYAISVGMTPEAAVYLTKLIPMAASDVAAAITQGLATYAGIKKEAELMAKAEGNTAPRKLAGAAALAVKRKEERLAAEAKALVSGVSDQLTQTEDKAAPDAGLPKGPVKGTGAKRQPDKLPKETADTPKTLKAAKKILKGDKPPKADAQVKGGQLDPAKLKNKEGNWKSASAMFKGLLLEGKLNDDNIASEVDARFSLGSEKAVAYVKWNRGWFRREGIELPAAK